MDADKKLQLLGGTVVGLLVTLLYWRVTGDVLAGMGTALGGAAIAGLIKEVSDGFRSGSDGLKDIAYAVGGGAVGSLAAGFTLLAF